MKRIWMLLFCFALPGAVHASTPSATPTPRPTTTPAMSFGFSGTATPTQLASSTCPSAPFSQQGLDPGWAVACGHCLQRATSVFSTYVPTYSTPTRVPTVTQSAVVPVVSPTLLPTATRTSTLVPPIMITIQDNDPRVSGLFTSRGSTLTNYTGPISVSLGQPMCITDVTLRVRRDTTTNVNTPNFIVLRIGSQVVTWNYLAALPEFRDAPFSVVPPVRVSSFELDAETFGGTRVIQLDYIKLMRDEFFCAAPTPTPTLAPTATPTSALLDFGAASYNCATPLYPYGGALPPVATFAIAETSYQCYMLFPGFIVDQQNILGNDLWDLYLEIPHVELCVHWLSLNFGLLGFTLPVVEVLSAVAVVTFITRYMWKLLS